LSKSVFSGVFLMSSSKLLEQAIVDAQALRDSAFKSAQATLLEKFAPQVKEAVEKLLEQEEDPAGMSGSPEDALAGDIPAGTDFGGAPPDSSDKGFVAGAAKDIPLAATDGEKLCPCPDDNEEVTLELDLAKLADELSVGNESEEDEDINMQPMLGGMQNQPQAAGGTGLAEGLELEELELEEELTEVDLDEVLSQEMQELSAKQKKIAMAHDNPPKGPKGDEEIDAKDLAALRAGNEEQEMEEGKGKPKWTDRMKAVSMQAKSLGKQMTPDEVKAQADKEEKARAELKKTVSESQTKELIKASTVLLKEVENKDAKIQNLLEENKKFSSIIEEMSEAFKKLDEVNLLNARLFYSNQVLKSASLNERQKTHIAEAISKADSVNEAKAVYETLINSVGGTADKERSPKSLNEVISKKSSFRLPHKQAEQLADPNKDRWLKLAGIK
jgi:hypothetical protein